jgi:hypothetical protein
VYRNPGGVADYLANDSNSFASSQCGNKQAPFLKTPTGSSKFGSVTHCDGHPQLGRPGLISPEIGPYIGLIDKAGLSLVVVRKSDPAPRRAVHSCKFRGPEMFCRRRKK